MKSKVMMTLMAGLMWPCGVVIGDEVGVAGRAWEVVGRQRGVFTRPPEVMPTRKVPDGPLLGNGDVGVAIGGVVERSRYFGLGEAGGAKVTTRRVGVETSPEVLKFYLAKNDFWKAKPVYPNAHPCPIGTIEVAIPALHGGEYHAEQVLGTAEVEHVLKTAYRIEDPPPFTRAGTVVRMRSWVAAGENLVVIELTVDGDAADGNPFGPTGMTGVEVRLSAVTGNESETATGNLADGSWAVRRFETVGESVALERKPLVRRSEAAVAMRLLGHRVPGLPWSRGDGWNADRFVLQPGRTVVVVASVVSGEESADPLGEAKRRVGAVTEERLAEVRAAHRAWWRRFWESSYVEVGDELIERYHYGSQYLLASCSRNRAFPPSLYGNWVTMDGPSWQADYHLNYNHEAPWWGVYSSNHVELADPYDTPVLEYLETAKANARELLKVGGAYYDVGIGPKGLETSFMPDGYGIPGEGRRMFLGQKSNAAFAAVNMMMRIEHTWDAEYARRVYPFLREVADFWESYLKLEGERYVVLNDASGEVGDGGSDRNNCLTLGLLRTFFRGMMTASELVGSDGVRREKWMDILSRLSDFPTVVVDGVRRIRGAEAGPAAERVGPGRNNTRLELMGMVWPSTVIGLESPKEWLQLMRDDVAGWGESEWIGHFNGFSMTFPGAVRVGHDPEDVLRRLRRQLEECGFPNLMVFTGGGGIENCAGVPATINEMLVQSHDGVVRVFPCWPAGRAARFGRLRVPGAFLVSSELAGGEVKDVEIESERGRVLRMVNPWVGREVEVERAGGRVERVGGERFELGTVAGERLVMRVVR